MIVANMPELTEKKDKEEVRKALIDLVAKLNKELDDIRARLDVLEAAP